MILDAKRSTSAGLLSKLPTTPVLIKAKTNDCKSLSSFAKTVASAIVRLQESIAPTCHSDKAA